MPQRQLGSGARVPIARISASWVERRVGASFTSIKQEQPVVGDDPVVETEASTSAVRGRCSVAHGQPMSLHTAMVPTGEWEASPAPS